MNRCVLAVPLLLAVGCGPAPYTSRDTEVPRGPRDVSGNLYQSARPESAQLVKAQGKIGRPCEGPTFPETICGSGNRIAGVYADGSDAGDASGFMTVGPQRSRVDVTGTRIHVDSACDECRSHHGWSFDGDLALMTKAQREDLQGRMLLPASPLLTTSEEWDAATSKR